MNRSTPGRVSWGQRYSLWRLPESRLLVPGFGLSLVWEVLQSPFYTDTFTAPWAAVAFNRLHCAGVDALILLAAFWIIALHWGRSWMDTARWAPYIMFLALGVAYTAWSEYVNVFVKQNWAYSRWMPTVAGIGLVPLLQWVIVPSVSLQLATREWHTAGGPIGHGKFSKRQSGGEDREGKQA